MKILVRNEGEKNWRMVSSFSYSAETELQKLLSESPDLIPSKDLREGAGDLIAVVREFPLPIGLVDLLAFSAYGDIAVIECKLADNPEIKRKVIGQVLEYGAALWGMKYEYLDIKIKERTGYNLADFVRNSLNDPDWDEESFRVHIEQNLKEGDFILVIVVDEINDNMTRIVRFLNACGNPNFSFAALEMRRFHSEETEILVPRVDGDFRQTSQNQNGVRFSWNRETVLEDAKSKLSPLGYSLFQELLRFIEEYSQAGVGYGTGKENGSITFYAVRDNVRTSIFSVFSKGNININFGYMLKIFSENEINEFKKSLSSLPPLKQVVTTDKYFYPVILDEDINTKDTLEQFKKVVLEFLKRVE